MSDNIPKNYQHIDDFRNIENWLKVLTYPRNLNTTTKLLDEQNINEVGVRISENFDKIFAGLMPTRRAKLLITTFNTLIRIYDADQYEYITSLPAFLSITKAVVNGICNIMESGEYAVYRTEIRNLLFMNFAKDDFLIKCLHEFYPNKPTSDTNPVKNNKQRSQTTADNIVVFLSQLVELVFDPRDITALQSAEDFSHSYRSLVESLLAYLDEFFNCYDEHPKSEFQLDMVENILGMLVNLTDMVPLVPMFIEAKYAETTVKWLRQSSLSSFIDRFGEDIMLIIYNLSRHKKGLKALRKGRTFETLMEYKGCIEKTESPGLRKTFGMLLIALPTSNDKEKLTEDIIREVSVELFEKSKKASNEPDWRSDQCHLSEYLYSLQLAFSNETIVQHILGGPNDVKKDNIQFFIRLFCSAHGPLFNQDVSDLEKLAVKSLLKIIWCISNYPHYRSELINDAFLCILVESLAKQPKQGVAKRIWCNLKDSKLLFNKFKKEKRTKIYISYNWSDEEFCRRFVSALREHINLSIWVDYEQTDETEDPWEYVAPVIESATVIIILASNVYASSKYNCQELNYAVRIMESCGEKKHFIAVNIEHDFHFNPGWINNLLELDKTIQYTDNIDELTREVAQQVKLSKNQTQLSFSSSSNAVTQSSVCILM